MKKFFLINITLILFWSCTEEPVKTVFADLDTKRGVYIACEGNFMYGNGSLSFYNSEKLKVTNQLFYGINNTPPGDVVQSLSLYNEKLYIVVNNSGKIYSVNAETVEFESVITGLSSPRYIHFVSEEKAYISDLYADHITIIDPASSEITGQISTQDHSSEQMVQIGSEIYVSSWSYDKYILVIDSEKDEMITKIEVPFQPGDLVVDKNDKIWVLSDGGNAFAASGAVDPALSRIDPMTRTIEQIYHFDDSAHPSGLELNSSLDTLFFINGDIYKMPVTARNLPDSSFIKAGNRNFYSLAVNPDNDEIYVADAIDYAQDAMVFRYSGSGALIDSFITGINPSDFLFR